MTNPLSNKPLLIYAILIAGMIPLLAYYFGFGRVASVSPYEAKQLLSKPLSNYRIVDVRGSQDFERSHVESAVNWPYEEIRATALSGNMAAFPEALKGKQLLLICESGLLSARAAILLREMDSVDATNIRGGMAAWIADAAEHPAIPAHYQFCNANRITSLPYRPSSWIDQAAALSMFWFIKPFYVLLSLILIWRLRRVASVDLKALYWALVFFFLGESFCYVDLFAYRGGSFLFEYLHSYGMVLSFAFVSFAIFEGIDRRIVRYSDATHACTALSLCHICPKFAPAAPCGLKRLFLFLTLACILLSFIPLTSSLQSRSYNTHILWLLVNFSDPVILQIFEIRFCPVAAIALFSLTFSILWLKKKDAVSSAKISFCAALGYLGFSYFRLFLTAPYRDNIIWYDFWEEMTELIYICGVAFALWLFRAGLFNASTKTAEHELDN